MNLQDALFIKVVTDKAPGTSKFKSEQRFVIQNEYYIFSVVSRR